MGTCETTQKNLPKSSQNELSSSSNKNNSQNNNKGSSINSKNEKEIYFLSNEIAKREDITKIYKLIEKKLGFGATSIVCEGENLEKKKFAVKRISKDKIAPWHKKNVKKEAEICQKFNHENIMKYYEIYEDFHYISIVMELGDTDLLELILHSPSNIMPEDIAIDFMIQIFESIIYLHSLNIIHCDIKPDNYIVIFNKSEDTIPLLKLSDFGNHIKITLKGENHFNFCGTKEYMAPEAVENTGFDEKVDEWAAGVVMYCMLTGQDPFSGDDYSDHKESIRFKKVNFDVIKNEKLRELNKKLLNRTVKKRITAKDALDEIKNIKEEKNKENNNINTDVITQQIKSWKNIKFNSDSNEKK